MIGLDTNVLVRFLVRDDLVQADRAEALLRTALARNEELFVSDVVMCETAWVLDRAYRVPRREIAAAAAQLLSSRQLAFEEPSLLARAVEAYARGRGGFADYVIRERALDAGCTSVATFDRLLQKEKGFQKL